MLLTILKKKKFDCIQENNIYEIIYIYSFLDYLNSYSIINSYKSKNDSKFYKIDDVNSIKIQGKFKYKLFHKCCFPGCNRTFSSSGWLKAHLKEHLKQIENNWFNKAFKKYIYKGPNSKKNFEQINKDKNKGKGINGKKKNMFIVDK